MRTTLRVSALLLAATSASPAQVSATKPWPTATPQSVGLNAAVLDSIDAEVKSGRYGFVDRILVIRRGSIAFDRAYAQDYDKAYGQAATIKGPLNGLEPTGQYNYYNAWWHPFYRRGDLHTLQSITKTITSVVTGVAITRGDHPAVDAKVLSFFEPGSVANVDDRKRAMTVAHLMSMSAGIDWNEGLPYTDPNNTATGLENGMDWVKYTIDRPMSEQPGTRYNYNSGATVLQAYVFHRATRVDIEEYAARHLFAPLGIQRWFWKRTPTGVIDAEGGLYLEARDLAKIGYLYLKDGVWDGKRLISSQFVKASVTPGVGRHGLGWVVPRLPRDTSQVYWNHSGFGGQFLAVLPSDDMVIVFNAWNIEGPSAPAPRSFPLGQLTNRLSAAVTERR